MTTVTHHGSRRASTAEQRGADQRLVGDRVGELAEVGDQPAARAMSPSTRSVIAATVNDPHAATRHAASCPPSCSSRTGNTGTSAAAARSTRWRCSRARRALAAGRRRQAGRRSRCRDQVDALDGRTTRARDESARTVRRAASAASMPSTSGPWWAAAAHPAPSSSSSSTRTTTCSPTRSSARWAVSSSTSWLMRAGPASAILVGELAVAGRRPRCRPRRSTRRRRPHPAGRRPGTPRARPRRPRSHRGTRRSRSSGSRPRGQRADLLEQLEERVRATEPAHPPQHGRPACWNDRSK